MHGVIFTPTFLADAKAAGLDDAKLAEIAVTIADDPQAGDLIVGTGGARKVRVAREGKGKSGGYRIVTYFAAEDVPVFLLALIDKSERANLTKAERNALRSILETLAYDYRTGVSAKVVALAQRRPER